MRFRETIPVFEVTRKWRPIAAFVSVCAAATLALAPIAAHSQVVTWAGATSGTWETTVDWTLDALPLSTQIADISATGGNYTVTMGSSHTVDSLILASSNATLALNANLALSDTLAGASAITSGTLSLQSAQINASGGLIYAFPNAGSITSTGSSYIYGTGAGLAFVNTGSVTVTSGTLTLGMGSLDTVTNTGGTMVANGGTLSLNGGTVSILNTGTIEATNGGVVNFGGSFTTAGLGGTIEIVGGGTLNITGNLNNALSLLPAPTGGSFTLDGGTISGGSVNPTSLGFSSSGGTLDKVTLNGSFTVPFGASFTATDGTVFTGTSSLVNNTIFVTSGATNPSLDVASGASWTGNVTIRANSANASFQNDGTFTETGGTNFIYGVGNTGFAVTNNGTISGTSGSTLYIGYSGPDSITNSSSGIINANGGNINVGAYNGVTVTNAGTLEASGSSVLTLGSGTSTWTNTGHITSNTGTIDLGGTFNTLNLTTGTINGTGGTVNIVGSLNNASAALEAPDGGGIFTLDGGTISGGIVDNTTTPALTFSSGNGTLDKVTLDGSFTMPFGATFTSTDGTVFTGASTLVNNTVYVTSGATGPSLDVASAGSWTGNVTIRANSSNASFQNDGTFTETGGTNFIYGVGNTGFAVTNNGTISATGGSTLYIGYSGPDSIANGSSGIINANGGTIDVGAYNGVTVTNAGILEASGSSVLTLGSGTATWTNTGQIVSNTGTIDLGGTFSTAALTTGTINGAGGTVNIIGGLNNASATLEAPDGGGIFTLDGGTISGGVVDNTTLPALTFSSGNGTLDKVTLNGAFTMPSGATFTSTDGTVFTGASNLVNNTVYVTSGATSPSLDIASAGSWTGNVTIRANSANASFQNDGTFTETGGTNFIYGVGNAGFAATNNGTISATGGSTLYIGYSGPDSITNNSSGIISANGGNINVGAYNGVTVSNAGTLEANGSSVLTLGGGTSTWTNTGHITSNTGTIDLGGTFSTAGLTTGTINGAGGTVNIVGGLNNALATLEAPDGGGIFTLDGGTISGGTVDNTTTPALTFSSGNGTLDKVTLNGAFTMPSGATFTATDGTVFTGASNLVNNTVYVTSGATSPSLDIASAGSWTGNVTIRANSSNASFQNDGTFTETGGTNFIYGVGNTGFAVTNNGTISATGGSTLYIGYSGPDSITNSSSGVINANGGNINVGAFSGVSVTNAGTLEANGSSVLTLGGGTSTWTNTGHITSNTGTIDLGGTFTTAGLATGNINGTGGTINITGSLNNAAATLEAPGGGGIFTLDSGTITGGIVDNTTTPALTFSNGNGTLDGVTLNGTFNVPISGVGFTATDDTKFTGTGTFANATIYLTSGTGPSLDLMPGASWSGNISIRAFSNNASFQNDGTISKTSGTNFIYGVGETGFSVTNNGTINVSGNGTLYVGYAGPDSVTNSSTGVINANGGTINVGAFNTATVANSGLLEANGVGVLNLGSGSSTWTNTGQIVSNSGTINLGGTFNTSNLTSGTINGTGGTVNLIGSLNNAVATLEAPNGGGIFTLTGGTITGGSVDNTTVPALIFSGGGGTVSDVGMFGNFTVPSGATFIADDDATFSDGTTTFMGSNTVRITGPTFTSMTISPNEIWTGAFNIQGGAPSVGVINSGVMTLTGSSLFYGAGQTGFTITNDGTINSTGAGTTVTIGDGSGDTFDNQGTVDASGANVTLGTSGAATTNFSGNTLTGGTWIASGTATIDFVSPSNSVTTIGSGTVVILNGSAADIKSGPSSQTLEQTLTTNDGSFELLSGRNFGSTSAGVTNNGMIQLGGGTFSTPSTLVSGSGSSLTGFGTFQSTGGVLVGSGVTVSPGSPTAGSYIAQLSFNAVTLGQGGAMTFDIQNAPGSSPGTDYDTLMVTGTANITATPGSPFTINLESINPSNGLPGNATFNQFASYQWTLLAASSVTNFSASDFDLTSSLFTNPTSGGTFSISTNGNDIFLNFTPVPEPATWALGLCGVAAIHIAYRLRRRLRT